MHPSPTSASAESAVPRRHSQPDVGPDNRNGQPEADVPPWRVSPGRGARARVVAWTVVTAVLLVGLVVWMVALRQEGVVGRPTTLQAGWLGLSAVAMGVWLLLATTPPGAIRLSPRVSKRLILTGTAVLLGVSVAFLVPLLSPQALRARLDGKLWLLGVSPYATSPAEAAALARERQDPDLAPDRLDLVAGDGLRETMHLATLNLPVSQVVFTIARAVEYMTPPEAGQPPGAMGPRTGSLAVAGAGVGAGPLLTGLAGGDWRSGVMELPWWRQLLVLRLLLAGVLLLATAELIAWLRQHDRSVWWALAFAWQPVVLVETGGMGHQEAIGVLFLIAGLRRLDMGRRRRAGLCLAVAAAVKPVALLALPFALREAWRQDPAMARRMAAWSVGAIVLLVLVPLLVGGGWHGTRPAFGSYFAAAEQNPSIYRLLHAIFVGPEASAERLTRIRWVIWIICGTGTFAAGVVCWSRHARPATGFYVTSLTFLLLSPVAPPWMVIWPLAMVPILAGRGGLTALVWSGTAVLFYHPATLAGEQAPAAALAWQFTPVYLAAVVEMVAARRTGRPLPPAVAAPASASAQAQVAP